MSLPSHPVVSYLAISHEAAKQIMLLLQNRAESCQGIRVAVRTRGCSGLSYTIEYAVAEKNISKFDDVIVYNQNEMQFCLYIDPKASMFLIGSEMIFKQDDLSSGFDFVNPNEKGRCGCGESFKV
jgi:iron-sulfur cluster assembly protein